MEESFSFLSVIAASLNHLKDNFPRKSIPDYWEIHDKSIFNMFTNIKEGKLLRMEIKECS